MLAEPMRKARIRARHPLSKAAALRVACTAA